MKRLAVAALLLSSACAAADNSCRVEEPRNESFPAAGVETLYLEAAAGSLRITGVSSTNEIRIRGTACSSTKGNLDKIRLTSSRDGADLRIAVDIPEYVNGRFDLEIELPKGLRLDVTDGSGAATIRNVEALDITDGSGELVISDIAGEVNVRDGSGTLTIQRVGKVTVEDGSGSISIREASDVLIDEDGSGSIEVTEVAGNVVIERDGSGSIDVKSVRGDFTVGRDGSGGVTHREIGGTVSISR